MRISFVSQINVRLLWSGHLLHCSSGTCPLVSCRTGMRLHPGGTCPLVLCLTGMQLGLESQTNVRLLWTGHLLHRSSGTCPLVSGCNFSKLQHALQRLVGNRSIGNWDCRSQCLSTGPSEYDISKKVEHALRHPQGILPYVILLTLGKDLIRSVPRQQHHTFFPAWHGTWALSRENSERLSDSLPQFTCVKISTYKPAVWFSAQIKII